MLCSYLEDGRVWLFVFVANRPGFGRGPQDRSTEPSRSPVGSGFRYPVQPVSDAAELADLRAQGCDIDTRRWWNGTVSYKLNGTVHL